MQLSLTYYSLGVTISFCMFWFENGTLIWVRYCHLLGIWYAFIVDLLFFSFFYSVPHEIYVDSYISKYVWMFLFLHTHQI